MSNSDHPKTLQVRLTQEQHDHLESQPRYKKSAYIRRLIELDMAGGNPARLLGDAIDELHALKQSLEGAQ